MLYNDYTPIPEDGSESIVFEGIDDYTLFLIDDVLFKKENDYLTASISNIESIGDTIDIENTYYKIKIYDDGNGNKGLYISNNPTDGSNPSKMTAYVPLIGNTSPEIFSGTILYVNTIIGVY